MADRPSEGFALRLSHAVPDGHYPLRSICFACGHTMESRSTAGIELEAECHVSAAHRDESAATRDELIEDAYLQAEAQWQDRYPSGGGQ